MRGSPRPTGLESATLTCPQRGLFGLTGLWRERQHHGPSWRAPPSDFVDLKRNHRVVGTMNAARPISGHGQAIKPTSDPIDRFVHPPKPRACRAGPRFACPPPTHDGGNRDKLRRMAGVCGGRTLSSQAVVCVVIFHPPTWPSHLTAQFHTPIHGDDRQPKADSGRPDDDDDRTRLACWRSIARK